MAEDKARGRANLRVISGEKDAQKKEQVLLMPDSRTMVSQPEVARVFGHLPAAFLQRLYFLQVKFGGSDGIETPVTALAEYLGCTDRHLWRVIRQLQNMGALELRQPNGPNSKSTFQVHVAILREHIARKRGKVVGPPVLGRRTGGLL